MSGDVAGQVQGDAEPGLSRVDRLAWELTSVIRSQHNPGDRLPSVEQIAATFDVSRSVVREAVVRLSARGLVDVRQGDGTYVRRPDGSFLSENLQWLAHFAAPDRRTLFLDMLEFRRVIESESARFAAMRATPEELGLIGSEYDLGRRAHLDGDRAAVMAADVRFHAAIAASSHNSLLRLMMDIIQPLMQELRDMYPDRPIPSASRDHEQILSAILDRRPDEAAACACAHIDHVNSELSHLLFEIPQDPAAGPDAPA